MNKRILPFLVLILMCSGFNSFPQTSTNRDDNSVKVLLLCPDRLGANFNFNIDDMEEYGWDLTIAGIDKSISPCPWGAGLGLQTLVADTIFTDITEPGYYDVVAIQPSYWRSGTPYGDVRGDQGALDLIAQGLDEEVVTWASCAGPVVLADADVLEGVRVQAQPAVSGELIAAGAIYVGEKILPVIDKNIVTCTRGMYFHYENIEAILTALEIKLMKNPSTWGSGEIEEKNAIREKNIEWSKTYGGENSDGGRQVVPLKDGGYLVCGYTYSTSNGYSDILLIKTDEEGNQLWSQNYGDAGWEYAWGACETPEGDFLAIGQASTNEQQKDFILIKTDADGNEIWTKTYGGDSLDVGRSVMVDSDGNYLLCGYTESFGYGANNIYVIKTDPDGNELWANFYGGSKSDMGRKIIETSDNNYLILGSTGSFGAGNRDVYLIKTDTDGNIIWSETYGTSGYQDAFDVVETESGDFYIAGHSDLHGIDFLEAYVVKTNQDGDKIWTATYEGSTNYYDYAKGIAETDDGNFMICGAVKNRTSRKNDVFLFMIDQDGTVLWEEEYGSEGSEWASSVLKTDEGDFVIAGHTESEGEGKFDVYMFKVSNPLTQTGEILIDSESRLYQNIPNPFSAETRITLNIGKGTSGKVSILDSGGKGIKTFETLPSGKHTLTWDGKDNTNNKVAEGIYYCMLCAGKHIDVKKLIVVR